MSNTTFLLIGIGILVVIAIVILIIGMIMRKSPKLEVLEPQPKAVQFRPTIEYIPTYTEYASTDHIGDDILYRGDLANNIPALESLCNQTPGCIAFNNGGYLKSNYTPTVPSSYNLYVLR